MNRLLGKTITGIEAYRGRSIGASFKSLSDEIVGATEMVLHCSDGTAYRFWHDQDCCETVYLADICGDAEDLFGSPVVQAEELSNASNPEHDKYDDESHTLGTAKGSVTFRWLGESSGYYSEEMRLEEKATGTTVGRRMPEYKVELKGLYTAADLRAIADWLDETSGALKTSVGALWVEAPAEVKPATKRGRAAR